MAPPSQQDTFIDDSDEQCPLCVEEFDLSDKNFRPCPCGYQVCQFCFNNIRTNMNGLCPACRRPYDEKTIEFKTVSPEEFKADMALKARKQVAAKQKEAEKRQNETLSRKNLAGLRVVQKNLVYVVGLNLNPRQKEDDLLKILRGNEFFGQYGKIIKIVVSKAKEGAASGSIGVYVTFAKKEDAATCIAAVDGSTNGDRVLRAQYGTTKYCSAFLRNEQCNNRSCMFLHETGEDSDSFSRQDLSSLNATQRPTQPGPSQPPHPQPQAPPQQAPQPVATASQPMHRQGSKDETGSRSGSTDASALPSSASWANKEAQAHLNRRASLAASRSSPSPRTGNASIASQKSEEPRREEAESSRAKDKQPVTVPSVSSESGPSQSSSRKSSVDKVDDLVTVLLNQLLKDITSTEFKFIFSASGLSPEEIRAIENHPCFIDVQGGMKRRIKREKDEATRAKEDEERAKQEAEAQNIQQATAMVEDENLEGGSLQLGGEPEERHDPRGTTGRISEPQSAIQPPSAHGLVGSPISLDRNFSSLSINGRSLTPQQLMMLKGNNTQSGNAMDQFQPFGGNTFDHGESNRTLFQHQMPHVSAQGHARHSSRFSFAGDSSNKNANTRIFTQQPNPLAAGNTQPNPLGNHLYTSGIQHPPPGLKTAGTPPISGGGMFGQGHGFTSASVLGGNFGSKDNTADLMREMQQGRGNIGGHGVGQSHDTSKREYNFPSSYRFPSPSASQAPALGLLGSFHGPQPGSYHELGQLKQKKKGKKHRHANTSSFGGGVVDLADPSILRARTHQGGAGAGQGLYAGQGQVDADFPPLAPPSKPPVSRMRDILVATPHSKITHEGRSTPPVPPGLGLAPGHPSPGSVGDSRPTSRSATPAQVKKGLPSSSIAPAVPIVPLGSARSSTPVRLYQGLGARPSVVAKGDTKEDTKDDDTSRVHTKVDPGMISLGFPKVQSSLASRDEKSAEVPELGKAGEEKAGAAVKDPAEEQKRVKPVPPGKLEIPDLLMTKKKENKTQQTTGTTKTEVADQSGSAGPVVPNSLGQESRPQTPITAVSRSSDSPAPRQPRTLRVLPTPKTEIAPSLPSSIPQTTAPMGNNLSKQQRSRQPSLASMSGAATPVGEVTSDNVSATSASLSRPNSPPLSKVGSAPVRHATKSQAKKERQAKAKAEETKKAEEEDPVKPAAEEVVQAPIIARQKKKKRSAAPTTGSTSNITAPTTTSTSNNADETPAAATTPSTSNAVNAEDSTPSASGPSSPPFDISKIDMSKITMKNLQMTNEDLNKGLLELVDDPEADWDIRDDQPTGPVDYNAVLARRPLKGPTKSASQLIKEMIEDGTIRRDHPFFKVLPSLAQRYDLVSGDYEELKAAAATPLTDAQKQSWREGNPVRIRTESGKLMGRILITPKGRVLRGLTDAEEDTALYLEKSIDETPAVEAFHPAPSSSRFAALTSPSPFLGPGDDFSLTALGYSSAARETLDAPRIPDHSLGFKDETGMPGPDASEEDWAKKADELKVQWESSKKETEALQKRLDHLIKKNRRLLGL